MEQNKEKKTRDKEDVVRFSITLNKDENSLLEAIRDDYRELGLPISKAALVRKLLWETQTMSDYREVHYGT